MPQEIDQGDLSYERDILPMKGQYFDSVMSRVGAGGFGSSGSVPEISAYRAVNSYSKKLDAAYAERQALISGDLSNQNAAMAYQANKAHLEDARRKTADASASLARLNQASQLLDNIGTDGTTTPDQKMQIGSRLALMMPDVFGSPDGKAAFDSFSKLVKPNQQDSLTVADYLKAGGDPDWLASQMPNAGIGDRITDPNIYGKGMTLGKSSSGHKTDLDAIDSDYKDFDATIGERLSGRPDPESFKNSGAESKTRRLVLKWGDDEDLDKLTGMSPQDQINFARSVVEKRTRTLQKTLRPVTAIPSNAQASPVAPQPTTQSPRQLFR